MSDRLTLIISLPRSFRQFRVEVNRRYSESIEGFITFLKAIRFAGMVEQVISAAVSYPRSRQECEDALLDLGYGIIDTVDRQFRRLTREESDMVNSLVQFMGREVLDQLDAHGYYDEFPRDPDRARIDHDYTTNYYGVSESIQLRSSVFRVRIRYYNNDEAISRMDRYTHELSRMIH